MTTQTTTQLTCDGCSGVQHVLTLSYVIDGGPQGKRSWRLSSTPTKLGWKQLRKTATAPRLDFCPDCVKTGRAHR